MKGLTAMFLCIMALFVLASCENTTRALITDKDTVAVTDTAITGDNDTVQNDDIQNDNILNDDPLFDDILPDGAFPDNAQNDNAQNDNWQNDNAQNDNAQNDDWQNDNAQNDNTVTPDADIAPLTCNDITCDVENSHCQEGNNGADAECVCDTNYHWNTGQCVSDELTATGTFSFTFAGPINAEGTSSFSLKGGEGTATFSHLDAEFQYGTVTIYNELHFPMANMQSTNIITMWVDSLGQDSKFFMFSLPAGQNTAGSHSMSTAQAIVTYGDMSFSGGSVTINCIRAMTNEGNFTIGTVVTDQLDVTAASGDLYDPAVLGASLPYPICPN